MQLGAANYKWRVFIHYRRPSRKFSLLSNTMLIWVWLSKVIKLLWIKRVFFFLLFYFFKRQLFPLFSFTYYKEVLSRELLVKPQLPHLLLQWWMRSNFPSEQVMLLTAAANAQCTAHPLCLFPSLFVFPNSSPSALQSHLSSSIYKWEAPLPTSQNFCLCSLPACSRLGGKSEWPSLDQIAAFKLGIKEPPICVLIPIFIWEPWIWGRGWAECFHIFKASFLIWLVMLVYSICWTEHPRASGRVAPWTSLEVYNLDISKLSLPWLVWSPEAWSCMFISPVEIPFSFYNNPQSCTIIIPFFQLRKLHLREVKQFAQSHTTSTMWK